MRAESSGVQASVEQLREAFDSTFAAPPQQRADDVAQFLVLRIGGVAYAVPVSEIAGFSAVRLIVGLPSAIPELLGVAGLRGTLLPVYSLEALLAGQLPGPPARWLFRGQGTEPIAFGFAEFERHLDVPRAEVITTGGNETRAPHVGALVRVDNEVLGVIDVASLVERIRSSVAMRASSKER